MIDITLKFICDKCGDVYKRFYDKKSPLFVLDSSINFKLPSGWGIVTDNGKQFLRCNKCLGVKDFLE